MEGRAELQRVAVHWRKDESISLVHFQRISLPGFPPTIAGGSHREFWAESGHSTAHRQLSRCSTRMGLTVRGYYASHRELTFDRLVAQTGIHWFRRQTGCSGGQV